MYSWWKTGWVDHQAQKAVVSATKPSWQLCMSDIPKVDIEINIF